MSDKVTIHFLGEAITALPEQTLLQALWRSGHRLVDHVGCLGGVCGACSGTYSDPDTGEPRSALACQLMVREGLDFHFHTVLQATAPSYRSDALRPDLQTLFARHPEVVRCRSCEACTLVCPQGIDAMRCVLDSLQGLLTATADRGLACVHCGLCTAVCEVGIAPDLVMSFARRGVGAQETAGDPTFKTGPPVEEERWQKLLAASPEELMALAEELG